MVADPNIIQAVDKQLQPVSHMYRDVHMPALGEKINRLQNFRGNVEQALLLFFAMIEDGKNTGSFLTVKEDKLRLLGAQKSTMNAVSSTSTDAQKVVNAKGNIREAEQKLDGMIDGLDYIKGKATKDNPFDDNTSKSMQQAARDIKDKLGQIRSKYGTLENFYKAAGDPKDDTGAASLLKGLNDNFSTISTDSLAIDNKVTAQTNVESNELNSFYSLQGQWLGWWQKLAEAMKGRPA